MWDTLITLLTNLIMGYSISEPVKLYEFNSWIHVYDCLDNYITGFICGMICIVLIRLLVKLVKSIKED